MIVEDVGGTGAFQNTLEAQTTLSVFQDALREAGIEVAFTTITVQVDPAPAR